MASLYLFYSKNVYFAIGLLTFHIFQVIASFVTLPPVSNSYSNVKVFFHDFFTTYVKESKFTKYVHRQINYHQEIFQNGRQTWVSFFLNHPVVLVSKTNACHLRVNVEV